MTERDELKRVIDAAIKECRRTKPASQTSNMIVDAILSACPELGVPTAKDALQAIAELPTGKTNDHENSQEDAYRAVEALFDKPPEIHCNPELSVQRCAECDCKNGGTDCNWFKTPKLSEQSCKKCGGEMRLGKATEQTFVGGTPDFPDDKHSTTFSAGGAGKLIDCMKCADCGWSVTGTEFDTWFHTQVVAGKVTIKRLVWDKKEAARKSYYDNGGWTMNARSAIGKYTINQFKSGKPSYLIEFRGRNIAKGQRIKTEKAAQAVAQSHYDTLILTAIGDTQ